MPRVVGPVVPLLPIDIKLSAVTAQQFTYRMWWRDTASPTWSLLGEGAIVDTNPVTFQRPFTPGAQLYYWFAISGAPNAPYSWSLTFLHNETIARNGLIQVSGSTNEQSAAVEQDWVNLV